MPKLVASRRSSSTSATQHFSPLASDDVLYLSSADWVAGLSLAFPYDSSMPLSASRRTPLTPHSQSLQNHMFSDLPVSTFEHGLYLNVNSQLPWSTESLMAPPLHNVSSQGSSPEARLLSESPSLHDAEGDAAEPKKPKRSRPNRYKNAPPAVIQRRRAANRKSQRAYRKRKDDRIAELEALFGAAAKREQQVSQAYATLRTEYEQLLLILGRSQASSDHGRSPSIASTCAAAAATIEEEAAAASSTFLTLAGFAQQNSGRNHGLSPPLAHPQQQQPASSPRLLSVYPLGPM